MKYSDLFLLHAIENVIEIADADKEDKARTLVSSFVLTSSLKEEIKNVALPILDPKSAVEGKGLFVVGNYGTGKSHLMSFLSIIAENAAALDWLRNPEWRHLLAPIAGKYKVRRYEINVQDPASKTLYDVVADQLETLAAASGVDFTFAEKAKVSNPKDEYAKFMAAFESKHTDVGVLLILDEVLAHLRKLTDAQLVRDLELLRSLGEFADQSRLKFIAGVQRSLFGTDEFRNVSSEISRIRQRFNDILIDTKGIEELIETYLFEKNESQKAQIKEHLLRSAPLYDTLAKDIDRFVRLFPAHPKFIEEFERVTLVERREILKVLSAEAKGIGSERLGDEVPRLITSDRYWSHIERDAGIDANVEVRKVKQNVATLKERIGAAMPEEDQAAAERLVMALAVNRLTTSNTAAHVGLTPADLKDNLLWFTSIPIADPTFLTQAAKRALDKVREAANGQFLAKSSNSDHYFIDPTLNRNYDQEVQTEAKRLATHVVQRYLNAVILEALEYSEVPAVREGKLWEYALDWTERKTERPGWLSFGFPDERLTANPPKDFYIFVLPSPRVDKHSETISPEQDEAYWSFEGFPTSRLELGDDEAPITWLDKLRLYASARELASRLREELDEHAQFAKIADRILGELLPELNQNANDWVSVQYKTDKKSLGAWFADFDPSNANAGFRTKLRSLSQWMFSAWFEQKYSDYPSFPTRQSEASRLQNAQLAIEMIAQVGLGVKGTDAGRGVLRGLELYDGETQAYAKSRWLQAVRQRLQDLEEGKYLNASDLIEEREGRKWLKGEHLEAEWLMVVLAAGVAEGDLVIVGKNQGQYDATRMEALFGAIKSPEDIVRIGRPKNRPLEEWKQLFEVLGIPKGELAYDTKLETAVSNFVNVCNERIIRLVAVQEALKVALPFQNNEATSALADRGTAIAAAKNQLENLKTLNSRARMANLGLGPAEITAFGAFLKEADSIERLQAFAAENDQALGAIGRYKEILRGRAQEFEAALSSLEAALNEVYAEPNSLPARRAELTSKIGAAKAEALKAYQDLHKAHRLDGDGQRRKARLAGSREMRRLHKLASVEALGPTKLDAIRHQLDRLIAYQAAADDQLLKSATSLHPDGFDPRLLTSEESAAEVLQRCEHDLADLHQAWQERLVKELGDPSVKASFSVLLPEERTRVDEFLASETLPDEIDNSFVSAVNSLLKGLRKKPVSLRTFASEILGDGVPLRPEELRQRVEVWIKKQTQNEDPNQVRFVMED